MLVASNTSPICKLAIIGRLDLLRTHFREVLIPEAVRAELHRLSHAEASRGFIKRGGGIVTMHGALCGPDSVYFHPPRRRHEAPRNQLRPRGPGRSRPRDRQNSPDPSGAGTKAKSFPRCGCGNTSSPGARPAFFAWMQSHNCANYSNYQIQRTLLRGIAWAGKKEVDSLVNYVAPPQR